MIARYDVQAAGIPIMQVEAQFDLEGPRYLAPHPGPHDRGIAGGLASSDQVTSHRGRLARHRARARPLPDGGRLARRPPGDGDGLAPSGQPALREP